MSWRIKVPATTANLGAGFDSIGVALDLYLFIKVSASDEWAFVSHSKHLHDIPKGKDNYIYKIAKQVADRYDKGALPACHVELFSDIPLARGLGSSATAIACGIELANLLLDLHLSDHDKVQIATEIEGTRIMLRQLFLVGRSSDIMKTSFNMSKWMCHMSALLRSYQTLN
ncbi:hypothetical protein [Halolactibacillus sp. JCM 19043]|uniref:GHMP family kinase ATP-binding protein n=1 Tax=Halolactibacillus sp. JCM 19043 TaxID=1460638 RepID=UPI000A5B9854|nr:hypothetical protein [Halolactibacillus sp. JCM 19043]